MLPDAEQRLLRGALGELDVAQGPVRHSQESIRDGVNQVGKCLLVAACARLTSSVSMHINGYAPAQTDATSGMGDIGLSFFKPMAGPAWQRGGFPPPAGAGGG